MTSGLFLLVGFFCTSLVLQNALYVSAIIIGGWYFGREAFEALVRNGQIGIELLMATAAIVAGVMGQWAEAAMLVFLYSISEAAEGYTAERARRAVRELMDLAPKTALTIRNGQEAVVSVDELSIGDHFIVRPGEAVATDGEIVEGYSSLDQSPVTGESLPVQKAPGDSVFASSLNGEGALVVRVTKTSENNILARMIHLVEEAQASKGKSQRFIERFGNRYSPTVFVTGFMLALVPALIGLDWREWLERATVFIVAAAPCALVISIPMTLVAAIGTAGRRGILIKGGVHLENLGNIRVIALDKTGTLTLGRPQVVQIVPLNGCSELEVLALAAAVERRSQHPLARAVLDHAVKQGIELPAAVDFQSITGAGAHAVISGQRVFVGSPSMFGEKRIPIDSLRAQIEDLQEGGQTVIVVGTDQNVLGLIAVADTVRPEAELAVRDLRKAGIERVVMLTGDNARTADAIGVAVGVDEVCSDLSPEGKITKVKTLERQYGFVAMVGDGINDAPALAAAHVGIAMGAAGTDVALETADVALTADDLSMLPYLIRFGRRTRAVILQNLVLSVFVILGLIVGAISGVFALPAAVIAHELSEFVVIASGLRMLKS